MAYNVYISCDRCGSTRNWVNHTVNHSTAVALARAWGWQVGKRGWFCPLCKHKANRRAKKGE